MTDDILLNMNLVNTHKKDFLTYMLCLQSSNQQLDWSTQQWCCGDILSNADVGYITRITGLTRQTVRNHIKQLDNDYEYAGSMAILPRSTWERLLTETVNLNAAAKNGVIRTFCYFVVQCWSYQEFCRSESLIADELGNRIVDVLERIDWLVKHGFLAIKKQHRHFEGVSIPRTYWLYVDEVPPHYATEWWFIGNLAARETTAVEDVLEQFKNIF